MQIGITGGRGTLGKILQGQLLAAAGQTYDCFTGVLMSAQSPSVAAHAFNYSELRVV